MRFSLAILILVELFAVRSGLAQKPPELSVGQRLAADLTWTQEQRDERFAHMDRIFPVHRVARGGVVRSLPADKPLLPDSQVGDLMRAEHLAAVLVLQDGRIRNERYDLGLTAVGRWTSFSMTKAVTDTLVGVALRQGKLRSLDDQVTMYLPEMKGSAYEGVTVRQLMTMTSGVRWNENYTSSDADNVRLYTTTVIPGKDATVEYMRTLPRASEPGKVWHYNTGETDLLGVLLRRATGKTLAAQLSGTLWSHAGMEHDATWIANDAGPAGAEFGGSGLSASLRDFGRLGLWVMDGGGSQIPEGWFAEATKPQVKAGGTAYGYGWWPQPDGSFAALGIFGQSILIDPQRELVVVMLGDWDQATGSEHSRARAAFWHTVQQAVDAER